MELERCGAARSELESVVVMMVSPRGTLEQLVARRILYPVGFELPYVESAERRSIALHLAQLQQAGAVRAEAEADGEIYALA